MLEDLKATQQAQKKSMKRKRQDYILDCSSSCLLERPSPLLFVEQGILQGFASLVQSMLAEGISTTDVQYLI